ncbi:MAG: hypothetical protein AAFQ98_23445, partial [Bacteroidota bacterium]
ELASNAQLLFAQMAGWLDDFWPPGTGFSLDATMGATFIIPVGVDTESNFYMWREVEGYDDSGKPYGSKIKMVQRGYLGAGLDAGVGVGFYLGSFGKKKINKAGREESWGVSAAAAAQIKAGRRIISVEEFEFDLKEDYAVAVMMLTVLKGNLASSNPGSSMAVHAFCHLFKSFNIEPYQYLTKIKLEYGGYVTANAGAYAGLEFGSNQGKLQWSYKKDDRASDDDSLKWYNPWSILMLLRVNAAIGAELTVGVGLEIEFSGHKIEVESGLRLPENIDVSLFAEAQANGALNLGITVYPFVNFAGRIGFGGGLKGTWSIHNPLLTTGTFEGLTVTQKEWALYLKQGELDTYSGPAHEMEFKFKPLDLNNKPQNLAALVADLVQVQSTTRLGIDDVFFTRWGPKLATVNAISSLRPMIPIKRFTQTDTLSSSLKGIGLSLRGYLTYKWQSPGSDFIHFLTAIVNDIMDNEGDQSLEAISYLYDYFVLGEPPEKTPELVSQAMATMDLYSARVHLSTGIGLSAGANVGIGAKARLSASLRATVILMEEELWPLLQPVLASQSADWRKRLGELYQVVAQNIQPKFDHFLHSGS